jgi:hypothetical protein
MNLTIWVHPHEPVMPDVVLSADWPPAVSTAAATNPQWTGRIAGRSRCWASPPLSISGCILESAKSEIRMIKLNQAIRNNRIGDNQITALVIGGGNLPLLLVAFCHYCWCHISQEFRMAEANPSLPLIVSKSTAKRLLDVSDTKFRGLVKAGVIEMTDSLGRPAVIYASLERLAQPRAL